MGEILCREFEKRLFYNEMGSSVLGCEAVPEEKEVAEAYYQLHARLAWRRLLELENVPASRSGMPSA